MTQIRCQKGDSTIAQMFSWEHLLIIILLLFPYIMYTSFSNFEEKNVIQGGINFCSKIEY